MPVTSRATLKSYFPAGGYPTAPQFAQEIDAYVHLSNDNELGIGESLSINAGLQRLFEINNNGPGAIGVGTEADPKYYMKFGDGVRPIQLPLINGFDLPGIVSPIDGMIFYVIDEGYLAHYFDGEWRNIGGVVPVLNFVPLAGTDAGSPITGRIRFEDVDGNETAFVGKNSEDDFGIWSEDSIHLNGFVPGLGATIMRFIDKVNSSGAQMSLNENGFDIYAADFFSGFKGLFANKYFGANYDENTFIQKKYVDTSGTYNFNYDGIETTFEFAHGFDFEPTRVIQALRGVSMVEEQFYLFDFDATYVRISFATPPVAGSNTVDFVAYR